MIGIFLCKYEDTYLAYLKKLCLSRDVTEVEFYIVAYWNSNLTKMPFQNMFIIPLQRICFVITSCVYTALEI